MPIRVMMFRSVSMIGIRTMQRTPGIHRKAEHRKATSQSGEGEVYRTEKADGGGTGHETKVHDLDAMTKRETRE